MRRQQPCCDAGSVSLRCLIVDDNTRFLAAARSTLSRDGIEVVGTATTPSRALQQTEKLRPDVVLVDIGLGEDSGFDLVRQLVEAFPQLGSGIVLISTRSEDDYADLIAASPAVGFIAKSHLSVRAVRELFPPTDSERLRET